MSHQRAKDELNGDRMSRAVLVLLAGYGLITFGWRPFLQWHRTGDFGVRVSGHSSATAKVASTLMVSGSIIGLRGVAAVSCGRRSHYTLSPVLRTIGLVALGAAVALTTRAQLDLGTSWRIGVDESERTQLVTEGSFAAVRNPIFSGMALAVVGAGVVVPSPATLLATAALLTGVEIQVRAVEEPYLLETHGDAYRAYARRTGRFVPGIGLLH